MEENVKNWVIKVISTCETPKQMEVCEALLDIYITMEKIEANRVEVDEKFHLQALKTNYYQHKQVNLKEKLM